MVWITYLSHISRGNDFPLCSLRENLPLFIARQISMKRENIRLIASKDTAHGVDALANLLHTR
jgi:hypothetical protein